MEYELTIQKEVRMLKKIDAAEQESQKTSRVWKYSADTVSVKDQLGLIF